MKLFKTTVKEAFGEYVKGQRIYLTPAEEYSGYYWVLNPITNKPTTNAVHPSLLEDIVELEQAA